MVDTANKAPSQGQSRANNLGLIFSALMLTMLMSSLGQAVIDLGFVDGENLTEEELDKRLNVLSMTNRDRDNF